MTTSSELIELIKLREGQMIEFKRSDIFSNPHGLAKSMSALANIAGGKILIGINNDGSFEGMKSKREHEEFVMNVARNNCDPPILPTFEIINMNSCDVYIISIKRFFQYPHAVKKDGGKSYFIRVGSTIREPSPQELAILFSGAFPYTAEPTVIKEENKNEIRWRISGPEALPDPIYLELDRLNSLPPQYSKSLLDFPVFFPLRFELVNSRNEPLDLLVRVYSTTRAIFFNIPEHKKRWALKLFPPFLCRKRASLFEKTLKIEVPGNEQPVNFTFDMCYYPKFVDLLSKRVVINYEFDGRTPSGMKFVSGPHRIELPIKYEKERKED